MRTTGLDPSPRWRRRYGALSALVVTLVLSVAACVPSTDSPPAAVGCGGSGSTAHKDLAYEQVPGVDPELLSLDLYEPIRNPSCGPAPMVVYIHGGGFRIGDKSNKIDDKVKLFTSQGWVFASINYRLSVTPAPGQATVQYPTHEQDAATAIRWIADHAGTYRGDPHRILLMGHSSGAFIASLLSTDTSLLTNAGVDPLAIRCTASLDTEYDVSTQIAQGGTQEALYRNAFGDDPATWAVGSPKNHTAPGQHRPDFLVFTQGPNRRTSGSQDFVDELHAGGTPAKLVDVSPLTHEEVNDAVGKPGDTEVTPPLMDFFRSCAARAAS